MDILDSAWLLRMLENGGKRPADKLLSLFICLDNWLSAPGVREAFVSSFKGEQPLNQYCPVLTARLVELALLANLPKPDLFVTQVLILLQGALAEELRNPGVGALRAAQHAATAILQDATKKPAFKPQWAFLSGGLAASIIVALGFFLNSHFLNNSADSYQAQLGGSLADLTTIDPELLDKVMALQSQIDSGHCPSPQLFALPQDEVMPYMNTIHYRFSTHPVEDSKKLEDFLAWYKMNRAWECYYPPSNGHTSVSWRSS